MAFHLGLGGLIVVAGGKSYPYRGDQAKRMLAALLRQFDNDGTPLSSNIFLQTADGQVEITLEDATAIINGASFIMQIAGD
jgi:hypothetical protein